MINELYKAFKFGKMFDFGVKELAEPSAKEVRKGFVIFEMIGRKLVQKQTVQNQL